MRSKNNYHDQIQDLYSYAKEAPKLTRNVTLQVTDSCDMACSYCLSGDTLIRMADGTDKPIRDIVVGDVVLGFEEDANSSKIDTFESEVIATYHRSARVSGMEFSGGSHLNITMNHEVLSDIMSPIDSSFVPSGMLRVGDRVFSLVGDYLTASESVTDVCDYLMPIDVFNIGTTSRTYVANGIAVHNCYQTHKGNTNMTRETAKRIIDMLFDMWERDDPNEYIDKSTQAIVLDFIGGEPLLNIDVIDYACDYFWNKALELRCPWADTWRASMISNGTQYFNPKVQSFIRKYADKLSFGITIDGDKEMHDSCRKHHDGRGNFEEAHAAQKHFHETYASVLSTKVTIAPENLDKLHSIVKYFIDNGYSQINANTIYEAEWTLEQAQVYYSQLKQISDYLIDNDIDVPVSLFSEWAFKPLPESENQNWCFKAGTMISTPNGHIPIENISAGDMVYTFGNEIHAVESVMKRESNESAMIRVTGAFRTYTTPDHPFLCKRYLYMDWKNKRKYSAPRWIKAKDIQQGDKIALYKHRFGTVHIDKHLAYVVGRFIGDGSLSTAPLLSCSFKELDEVRSRLDAAGLVYSYHTTRTTYDFYISRKNVELIDILSDIGRGSSNKRFPQCAYEWDEESVVFMLEGLCDADGCIQTLPRSGRKYMKFNTVSPSLIADVMYFARAIGYFPTCSFDKRAGTHVIEGRTVNVRDRYAAEWMIDKKSLIGNYDDEFGVVWSTVNEVVISDDAYDVYNMTVSNNHSYVANGMVVHNCGSSGKMLSFDPDGKAFPCIRFMESSLNGSQKPMCVGDCVHGIYKTDEDKSTLEMLESMTRRSQSNDECFYCPIAAGCAWCNGWQYQKFGTPNKRDTASCIMHKARSLANVYYWNKKYRKEQSDKRFNMYLPKEDAIEIIGIDEYNLLSELESHPQE